MQAVVSQCHKINLNFFFLVSTIPQERALPFLKPKKYSLPEKNQAGGLHCYLSSSHGFLCCLTYSALFKRKPTAAPAHTQERIRIQPGSFVLSPGIHKAQSHSYLKHLDEEQDLPLHSLLPMKFVCFLLLSPLGAYLLAYRLAILEKKCSKW